MTLTNTTTACLWWSPSSITGLAWTGTFCCCSNRQRRDLLTLPLVLAQPFYSSPCWIITKNKEPYLCRDHFGGILNCDFYLLTNSNLFVSCEEAPCPGKTIGFIINLAGTLTKPRAVICSLHLHTLKVLLSCDINLWAAVKSGCL